MAGPDAEHPRPLIRGVAGGRGVATTASSGGSGRPTMVWGLPPLTSSRASAQSTWPKVLLSAVTLSVRNFTPCSGRSICSAARPALSVLLHSDFPSAETSNRASGKRPPASSSMPARATNRPACALEIDRQLAVDVRADAPAELPAMDPQRVTIDRLVRLGLAPVLLHIGQIERVERNRFTASGGRLKKCLQRAQYNRQYRNWVAHDSPFIE